jgi:TRAP-type C4-dicarboxylate transport system permease small subunit
VSEANPHARAEVPEGALHQFVGRLATWLALLGSAALVLIVVMTCMSIVGRALDFVGLGPIPGDYELVEAGIAFVVFSYLPWCQLRDGHARVDLLQRFFSPVLNWALEVLAHVFMLTVSALLAWRLYEGMLDKFRDSETTFILELPLGWGYAGALPGALVFVLVSASCLLRSVTQGRPGLTRRSSP